MSNTVISYRDEDGVDVSGRIYDQLIQVLSPNPLDLYSRRLNTKGLRTRWAFFFHKRLCGGAYEQDD